MAREVLGHIDCPCCGTPKGMRVTPDRNGAPFGYCEANCNAQLRVGGDARRVAAFVARYPWAAGKKLEEPAPAPAAPAPVQAAKPAQAAKQAAKPAQPQAPKAPPKKRASMGPFDYLMKGKDDE